MSQGKHHQPSTACPTDMEVPTMENESLISSPYYSDSHNPQHPVDTAITVKNDKDVKTMEEGIYKHPPSYEYGKDGSSSSIGSDLLPSGWTRSYDAHGREYYVNYITRVTQWEHPGGSMPYYADVDAKMSPPPPPAYDSTTVGVTIHEDGHEYGEYQSQPSQPTLAPENVLYDLNQTLQDTSHLLTAEQLEEVPYRIIPVSKYDENNTCGQAVCHVLRNNICLTIVSLLIWCSITAGLLALLITRNPLAIIALGIAVYFYLIYFCVHVCVGQCLPFLQADARTSTHFNIWPSERIVDTLKTNPIRSSAVVMDTIDGVINADPHLEIIVECTHTVTTTKTVKDSKGRSSTRTETKSVTTYKAKRCIPILRYKDISVQPAIFGEILDRCPSNTINITYDYLYELDPSQIPLLEACMKQLYYDNWWRDEHIRITVQYCVPIYKEKHVDLLVKQHTRSQRRWRVLCFNRCSFWTMACSSLLLIYLMLWHRFIKTVDYQNVKYLHIGIPDTDKDLVIYSSSHPHKRHSKFREYSEELSATNNPQFANHLSHV